MCVTAYTSSSGDASGGHGGAIYTGESGVTSISGLSSVSHNSAFSGGALYNLGTTILASITNDLTTQFADNEAEVSHGPDQAHGVIICLYVGQPIFRNENISGFRDRPDMPRAR